nr:retrovirus-related Pol polyprotein from transposon TNT 1-94 [Tanacetum cinerariifolium]
MRLVQDQVFKGLKEKSMDLENFRSIRSKFKHRIPTSGIKSHRLVVVSEDRGPESFEGYDAALETSPAYMKACEKATLMKKAYNTLILCLGDRVLREVTKETTAVGIWTKLTSLYMTKSLANRLYLKKKLYTCYMSPCTYVTSSPSSYENFMETLLYGRESLTMEDVLETLNSMELKKITKGTKEETGDGLYVGGRGSSEERLSNEELKWVRQEAANELFIAIWSSGSFFALSSQPFDQLGAAHGLSGWQSHVHTSCAFISSVLGTGACGGVSEGLGRGFGVERYKSSLLDSLRKLPVDSAFAVDFQSCVDIIQFLTDF